MIAPAPQRERAIVYDRVRSSTRVVEVDESTKPQEFVERSILKHPLIALTIAGSVGVAIGWFVKRRGR